MMRDFRFEDLLKSYRARIVRLGWTQEKVAEKLGVGKRTYQGWEVGESIPSNEMLQRLARFFELRETEADILYRAASQVAPEVQNFPFPRNPFFTGRQTYLEQLDTALKESRAVAITQPISISGLGGIGKTQLALEYAHRCYPKAYRTVLWVNASDKTTLETGYLFLAQLLNLPERDAREVERIVQAVKMWLAGHTGWLLILDNADDLLLVRTFLPAKPRGSILLTTRSPILGSIAAPMVLETMEPEEGLRFLLRRSGFLKPEEKVQALALPLREAAAQLVDLLGGHPLALDQAGAYIEETATSFQDYLRLYREQRRILLEKRGMLGYEHPESVVVTFEVCFQRARALCPSAADVLSLCALLHPDAIPEEIFSHNECLNLSTLALDDAIKALREHSLIERHAQDKLLSVHRLVQAVRKDGMDEQTLQEWKGLAVLAVNAALPHAEFAMWLRCERLLPHALLAARYIETDHIINEEAGRLLYETAFYLRNRAHYSEAGPLFEHALSIREQQLGPEHSDVAYSCQGLANLYREQGKYAEAKPLYQRALQIWEKQLGPEHPQVAYPLTNLGNLYNEQGQYGKAERLFRRALRIREQQLGPEHLQVAYPLYNLGNVYSEQGKYAEAEPLYQRALRIREQQLGTEHPDVAYPLHGLANLYKEQEEYEEAERLFQRVLRIWEQQLGPAHPHVAHPLYNLADLYRTQDKYTQAEPLYQQALRIWEQQLGPEHSDVAYGLNGLANLYLEQGKYMEAEPLFLRAQHIREQQLGPTHHHTAESIHDLARLREAQGNNEEARSLYARALTIREQTLVAGHSKTMESRKRLIALLHTMGRHEEAARFEQVVSEEEQETHHEE